MEHIDITVDWNHLIYCHLIDTLWNIVILLTTIDILSFTWYHSTYYHLINTFWHLYCPFTLHYLFNWHHLTYSTVLSFTGHHMTYNHLYETIWHFVIYLTLHEWAIIIYLTSFDFFHLIGIRWHTVQYHLL